MAGAPDPLVLRGREAFERGDLTAAAEAADQRLKAVSRDIDALELRFLVYKRRGQALEAVQTLDAVIGIDPQIDWAYSELVSIFMGLGKLEDAAQVARAALRIDPRSASRHNLFGLVLSEMNDLAPGEWHFRRALQIAGSQAPNLRNLALNLLKQGRPAEADGYFAEANRLAPRDANTLAHWATLHDAQGDLKRARELLDAAEAASSPEEVSLLRAKHLARTGGATAALAILDPARNLGGDGQLERGRLRERVGRYVEAWTDFVEGKRKLAAESGGRQYKAQTVEALFGLCRQFFTREHIDLLPRAEIRADVPQPIFITGFPRSGTTLLEQILTSHSQVSPGGELTFLGELRKFSAEVLGGSEPFPGNLALTWMADRHFAAALFRDYYYSRAAQYGLLKSGRPFFTDKMPFNEIWLPLLKMAFPHARIIRMVRHPLDVSVSMMANNMTHGFNCAYRIDDLTRHLASVFDLVEGYAGQLDSGELVLKYEALIEDQESMTRSLLAHVGLPFEESCLRFHENRRYAPTPSYAQVTERLNDKSVGRHQHYAQALKPYVPRLAPMMRRFGYS